MERERSKVIAAACISSALTAMLFVAVPAAADGVRHALFAHNADKVDGKHAVGAGASRNKRANKLVATNTEGRFPANLVAAPSCPSGTILNENACIEASGREVASLSAAIGTCADLGRRLPSASELMSYRLSGRSLGPPGGGVGAEYTSTVTFDDGTFVVQVVGNDLTNYGAVNATTAAPYRCVEPLS